MDPLFPDPQDLVTCDDCTAHFTLAPGMASDGVACPECGGKRLFRGQPNPTQSDGTLRNMVDSDSQKDEGGNPLGEGTIVGGDGFVPQSTGSGRGRDDGTYGYRLGWHPEDEQAENLRQGNVMELQQIAQLRQGLPAEQQAQIDQMLRERSDVAVLNYLRGLVGQAPEAQGQANPYWEALSPPDFSTASVTERVVKPRTLNTEPYLPWTHEAATEHLGLGGAVPGYTPSGQPMPPPDMGGPSWQDELAGGLALAPLALALGPEVAGGGAAADAAAGGAAEAGGEEAAAGGGLSGAWNAAKGVYNNPAVKGLNALHHLDQAGNWASNLMNGAMGTGAQAGSMVPEAVTQAPSLMSLASQDIPFLLVADMETPLSTKSVDEQEDDPHDQDQKEFADGDDSPSNHKNPNNEDSGADGEDGVREATPGYGFGENSPGLERLMMVLPLLLHYYESPESGANDPIVKALHETLEQESPGYLGQKHPDGDGMIQVILQQHKQPRGVHANHVGPVTPEQIEAVAQLLISQGRSGEVESMKQNPQLYAKELQQVQQNSQPAPPLVDPSQATPPAPMEAAPGGMPMPGMGGAPGGQPMQPMASRTAGAFAKPCPACFGHGIEPTGNSCESCGGSGQEGNASAVGVTPRGEGGEAPGRIGPMDTTLPTPPGPLQDSGMLSPTAVGLHNDPRWSSKQGKAAGVGPEDYYEGDQAPSCPVCGGSSDYMGTLGSRDHFRCRHCGFDHSQAQQAAPTPEDLPSSDSGIPPGYPHTADANNLVPRCPNPKCNSATTSILDALDGEDQRKARCHACENVFDLTEKKSKVVWAEINPVTLPANEQHVPVDREHTHDSTMVWKDKSDQELQAGQVYELHSPAFPVPDEIRVLDVKPDAITVDLVGQNDAFDPGQAAGRGWEISRQEAQLEHYTFVPSEDPNEDMDDRNTEPPSGTPGLEQVPPSGPTTDQVADSYPNTTVSHVDPDDASCLKCGSTTVDTLMSSPTTRMHECLPCGHVWETKDEFEGRQASVDLSWLREDSGPGDFHADMERARAMAEAGGSSRSLSAIAAQDERLQSIKARLDAQKEQRVAGRHFTPGERRELIDESGRARNLDDLDLSNTHYDTRIDYTGKSHGENVPDEHLALGL